MKIGIDRATRIPKAATGLRKAPRQARARATINVILDGAAHILGERGWSGFTTNAVAERAGVSIGSLYQYFPDKAVLIETVRQRHLEEVLRVLSTAAEGGVRRALRIERFVDGMIAIHARFPAAHRALLEDAPQDDSVRNAFEAAYQAAYLSFFVKNARHSDNREPGTAAAVLAAAVAGAVHDGARLGMLDEPAFRQELCLLVGGFLAR